MAAKKKPAAKSAPVSAARDDNFYDEAALCIENAVNALIDHDDKLATQLRNLSDRITMKADRYGSGNAKKAEKLSKLEEQLKALQEKISRAKNE